MAIVMAIADEFASRYRGRFSTFQTWTGQELFLEHEPSLFAPSDMCMFKIVPY
jgi:hypothetical protein